MTFGWRRMMTQLASEGEPFGGSQPTKRIHLARLLRYALNQEPELRSPVRKAAGEFVIGDTNPTSPLSRRERGSGGEDKNGTGGQGVRTQTEAESGAEDGGRVRG